MLNRTSIPAPLPRMAWGVLRQGLSAGPNALLLQLMLIFVAASILTCVLFVAIQHRLCDSKGYE